MSRFYGVAVGRDGGASVRHGQASASAVLCYDTGGECLHRLTLEGFMQDGEPWVRVVYQGEELIARPFAQIRQVFERES